MHTCTTDKTLDNNDVVAQTGSDDSRTVVVEELRLGKELVYQSQR
jgi:hypothetical protein